MPRAAIVVNPISGSGRRECAVRACRKTLEAAGWRVEAHVGGKPGDTAHLATEAALSGADVVVAAGGDGTVRGVAAGLLAAGADAALGILPLGTANLLARDLGLPSDGREAARVLLEGRTAPLDTAEANGSPFLCCLGVGFDAHVVRRLDELRTGNISMASYVRPLLHAFRKYAFPPFSVTAADDEPVRAVLAIVLNTPTYGGFLRPAPDARPDDGLLDAVLVTRGGRSDLPRWLFAAQRGRLHHEPEVRIVRSTSFRIEADPALPYQVDGDIGADTPVDILIRPSAISVMRPLESRR